VADCSLVLFIFSVFVACYFSVSGLVLVLTVAACFYCAVVLCL
jgi:hypothetical protein